MRISTFLLFIFISNAVLGQLSGDVGLGFDLYSNGNTGYQKKQGCTFQFDLDNELNSTLSLTYGMHISYAKEQYICYISYYSRYYIVPDSLNALNIYKEKGSSSSLSVQYPVTLKVKLIDDKLFFLSGISLNIDNLMTRGGFAGIDPEISNTSDEGIPKSVLGFGHHIGVLYYPLKGLGIYGEWKTTNNKNYVFSYVEIGLKYRMFTNR
jgi:hypothetical protein